jgi:uncharacterized membrane protein YkvA (DUF1232 family)
MKKVLVGIIGGLSALYLVNPGFGVFEFIPDNIPFLGNLDEGVAATLLLSALAFFGIDLKEIFGKQQKDKK